MKLEPFVISECIDKECPHQRKCARFIGEKEYDSIVFLFIPRSGSYCMKFVPKQEIIDVDFTEVT